MKVIQLDMPLLDGRIAKFHRVYEMSIDVNQPTMTILFGSWCDQEAVVSQIKPDITWSIEMPNDASIHPFLLEQISATQPWNAGQIVDL